jgi:Caspase domain
MTNDLHFAVVIGINCYPGIRQQLTTARQDAEAMAAWLWDPEKGGLPKDNVSLITANPKEESDFRGYLDARPIRREVVLSLARFHEATIGVSNEAWTRTRLYIYAAGHGLARMDGPGSVIFADTNVEKGYLPEHLELSECEVLYQRFTAFSEVLIFSDCCREIKTTMQPAPLPFRDAVHRGDPQWVTAYAAEYSRQAGADPSGVLAAEPQARGFFTKALLEGLDGKATHDPQTGIIDSNQLGDYVTDRVPVLARAMNFYQHASFIHTQKPIPIVQVETPRKYEITVRLPEGWTGDVTLAVGYPEAMADKKAAASGLATFSVVNGVYRVFGGEILGSISGFYKAALESESITVGREEGPYVVTLGKRN